MEIILIPFFFFAPIIILIFELAMIYVAFTKTYENKTLWILISLLIPIGPLAFYWFVYRHINQK